jgi:alpha-tubulin suppressor-like RCC1 family protein
MGDGTLLSLPAGESEWVTFLLQRERRSVMEPLTMAAGRNRSFFVDANGALLACGEEGEKEQGLLGLREGISQAPFTVVMATPVPSLAGTRIRAVVCGECCNLALSEAGQVFAWGCQKIDPEVDEHLQWGKQQAIVPTVIEELRNHRKRQVAAGEYHCAALTEDGALFTWEVCRHVGSEGSSPELGYGSYLHDDGAPYRVFELDGIRIASVALGSLFTVAVTEAGAVYSFGMGDGRLGHRDSYGQDVSLPALAHRGARWYPCGIRRRRRPSCPRSHQVREGVLMGAEWCLPQSAWPWGRQG